MVIYINYYSPSHFPLFQNQHWPQEWPWSIWRSGSLNPGRFNGQSHRIACQLLSKSHRSAAILIDQSNGLQIDARTNFQ